MASSLTKSAAERALEDEGVFDKARFNRKLELLAVKVPCSKIGLVRSKLERAKLLLHKPRLKPILNISDNKKEKLILLNETFSKRYSDATEEEGTSSSPASENTQQLHKLREILKEQGLEDPTPYTYLLDYKYFTAEQVLRELLPKEVVTDIPTSFETVGHIAHLNLRDEQVAYKKVIGAVILDKNERIRTVVNKVQKIENQFRVLPMEVIAGEDDMETVVIQHGVKYKLNFAQVYWNSRLEHEHHRLVHHVFKPSDCILDMTCGVGPFTVPAALRGCNVVANDLNPKCAEYTEINCRLNKVREEKMPQVHCMDARDFVRSVVQKQEREAGEKMDPSAMMSMFNHAVINLPASGLEFIDVFRHLFEERLWRGREKDLPHVHCYTFIGKQEDEETVKSKIHSLLGSRSTDIAVREVRDVAPNKRMLLCTFQVPPEVAFKVKKAKVG
jgi:tRNA (guanine37-N1)-methyltransferase